VLPGVDAIDAARLDGDRPPTYFEGASMGFRIDPAREARHDDDAFARKIGRQATRDLLPIHCGCPRPDDRNREF
jgi:hypothetical protein